LFHTRRQVRGLPHGGVIHVQIIANSPHHHVPRVEPDAHLQLQALGPAYLRSILAHSGLHRQRRVTGPHGVVFVGHWRPEQGHDAVTQYLVDRALIAMHGVHHAVQGGVEELLGGFGVEVGDELGGPFQVGKHHRHLLTLAF
jgi:hypothetical protein